MLITYIIILFKSYFFFCAKEKYVIFHKCDLSSYSEKALHCVLYFPN